MFPTPETRIRLLRKNVRLNCVGSVRFTSSMSPSRRVRNRSRPPAEYAIRPLSAVMMRRRSASLRSYSVTSLSLFVLPSMREARRKVCPATTSLITCSLSVSDGFLRAMSTCRVRSSWLVRGSSWSFHKNDSRATPVAPASTGAASRMTLTPPACSAVISLSPASRVNTCSTATKTAIGSVTATMNGSESTNTSMMTPVGNPFPSRPESCLATCWMSINDVSAASATPRGATCWRRRYRLMVRTISGAIIFGSPSLYKTSLPRDHSKEPPRARRSLPRARRRLHRARRREPSARIRRRACLRVPPAADAVRTAHSRNAGARAHRRLDPRAPPRDRRHRRHPVFHARDTPRRELAPAELPRPLPPHRHRARAAARALGYAPERRPEPESGPAAPPRPRGKRRRVRRGPAARRGRRTQGEAARRRRRSVVRRRRRLRQFRHRLERRADRLALLRRPPAAGLPAAVRRAVRHGRGQGPAVLLRGQFAGRGAGSGGPRVASRRRLGVFPRLPPRREAHADRRPRRAAEGGHPRHRRRGFRLPVLAHHRRHHRQSIGGIPAGGRRCGSGFGEVGKATTRRTDALR